jgi:ketosteroid isomerase-like protein
MSDVDTFLSDWSDAERNGDGTALATLLTNDFLGVGPLGFVLPKEIWVHRFDQFGLDYETFDVDEVQTRVHGDAAVVTARQTARGTAGGQPVPEAVRATLTLVADSGTWRLAGIHMSFIAGTPGAPPLPGAAH